MVQMTGRATVPCMPDHASLLAEFLGRFFFRSANTTFLVIAFFALAGCDRNIEPYQPGEESSPPDLARIFPGPPGNLAETETAGAESGTPDRSALPPSRAEGSASFGQGNAAAIKGRIEFPSDRVQPRAAVLFVIARAQGAQGGPPLAVLRIPDPKFPLDFSIGPEHVMIPSMRFEGAISLSARLDADGNAMTRGSEDISSQVEEPLAPGTTGVRLLLGERG